MNISKEIKKALAEKVIVLVKHNSVSVNFLENILKKNGLPVTLGKVAIYKGGIAKLQEFSVPTLLRVLNLLGSLFQPKDPILVESPTEKWGFLIIPTSNSKQLEKELEKLEKELRHKAMTTSSRQLCRLFDHVKYFEFESRSLTVFVNPCAFVSEPESVINIPELTEEIGELAEVKVEEEVEEATDDEIEIETLLSRLKVAVHLSRELSPKEGLILNTSPASGVWKGEEDSFYVFNGGLNPEDVLSKGFIEDAVELLYCALLEVDGGLLIKERIEKISLDSWNKIMMQS